MLMNMRFLFLVISFQMAALWTFIIWLVTNTEFIQPFNPHSSPTLTKMSLLLSLGVKPRYTSTNPILDADTLQNKLLLLRAAVE